MFENLNPFNWGKENEASSLSVSPNIEGRKPMDISVPTFHFTEQEIAKFKEEGKTEEEIELERKSIINRLARAQAKKALN